MARDLEFLDIGEGIFLFFGAGRDPSVEGPKACVVLVSLFKREHRIVYTDEYLFRMRKEVICITEGPQGPIFIHFVAHLPML